MEQLRYAIVIACLLISLFCFLLPYYKDSFRLRWLSGMGIISFLLATGMGLTSFYINSAHYYWSGESKVYKAVLTEKPQEKLKSILCNVTIIECVDSLGVRSVDKKILLYLSKDSLSKSLKVGDEVLFYGKVSSPRNNGNPEEFDYARFLLRKGIAGTAFVYSGNWNSKAIHSGKSLKQIALSYREKVLERYRSLNFTEDNFAVLSALTLGYKDELSEDIRESYSSAGVSHVLALSGLHVGLFFMLIDFLLRGIGGRHSYRLAKGGTIILSLWAFAFVSGLSPSVVRSVTMFSLLACSQIFNMRAVTLNTVGAAALFMLLYNPFYLYDVSFQLSFLAVAAIVLLQPIFGRQLIVHNKVGRYIWQLITVSLAAQIGTIPFVLYYFSNFPILFLLANLLVIPLVTIILYIAVLLLLMGFFIPAQKVIAFVLNELISWLNMFVSFVERLPLSSVEGINFFQIDIWGYYAVFLLLLFPCFKRQYVRLMVTVCVLSGLCVYHVVDYMNVLHQKPSIVFYNSSSCPAVHFVSSVDSSYLLASSSDDVMKRLKYATERHWRRNSLAEPRLLSANYEDKNIWTRNDVTSFYGYTVCMIKDDLWKNKVAGKSLLIDYLYLCKGFKGRLEELTSVFRIRKVVLDGSLSEYHLSSLKKECNKLGFDCVSLAEGGALKVNIAPSFK